MNHCRVFRIGKNIKINQNTNLHISPSQLVDGDFAGGWLSTFADKSASFAGTNYGVQDYGLGVVHGLLEELGIGVLLLGNIFQLLCQHGDLFLSQLQPAI